MNLTLRRDDEIGPDALALIGESEAELSAIYPAEVRYAFSPDQLTDAGVHFVVAYRDKAPVGCGGYARLTDAADPFGELKRIFVTQAARSTGVAEALVATLEEAARADGLSLMRLETGDASPAAIRLYQRLGYARRDAFASYVENGSSVFMEKPL